VPTTDLLNDFASQRLAWQSKCAVTKPTQILKSAACAAATLLLAANASAQSSLPAAPSAVLAAQRQSQPAGSGMVFTASSTTIGPAGELIEQPKDGALALSLDDAISIGLERNIRLRYDRANEREVKGDNLSVLAALSPNLKLDARSNAQQINLAAMGFKPSLINDFASTGLLPPGTTIATIVKVNTTQASISAKQLLFNVPDYQIYRGTKNETAVVLLNTLNDRGTLVLAVSMAYLQVLADQANFTNAQAQERSASALFSQATEKHNAGVGTKLDALRGQVEYQQRQQDVLAAQSSLDKDTIQLARIMGLPAGQKLTLTDVVPFADLGDIDLDAAKATAYSRRKDLLGLDQQIELTARVLKAVKYQRLPTLAFSGMYGIIGITNGSYHGDFNAIGTLSVPIFHEAAQRGEQEVIDSQLTALRQRESDLRITIDAQIRSAMLDVNAARELVRVAQSNVELAREGVGDARERFLAGVDDTLPVVDGEATLASAQAQLVKSLYQYNVAKLQLARATGVVETEYRSYLGK
jgi:outer membrane protein TolC